MGAAPLAGETHISSLVVHCRPERAAAIGALVGALPGAEVAARTAEGKLVVTLETATEGEIVDRLNAIQLAEGVLAATLVLHHVEPNPDGS